MQADLSVLESLQKIAGTTDGDNLVFNSSLPLLLTEFQKMKKVADQCTAIADSLKDVEGASILVSAVSDVKSEVEKNMLGLQQKICKGVSDGLDAADRHVFLALEESTQDELKMAIAGDAVLLEARAHVAKMRAAQSPPNDWIGSHLTGGSSQPAAVTNANPFGKVVGSFNDLLD